MQYMLQDYEDWEVTEWLKYGFPVARDPMEPDPIPCETNHWGASRFPDAIDAYIEKEIKLRATMGPFSISPFLSRIGISPLSSRPKRESTQRRIILDLSFPEHHSVNSGISSTMYCGEKMELTYPSIDTLTERIAKLGKGCLLWKIDLQRFFRQLPICPLDYSLIGYRWNNFIYHDRMMPMGLRSAAFVAQKTTNAIVFIHRTLGYWSINYLDDFGSAEKRREAWDSFLLMKRILKTVGAVEAEEKAVAPTTRLEFLGNTADTEKMTIEVSPSRITELTELLQKWLHKKYYTKKQLQSLVGKLSFVTNCVRPGRIFLSRIIEKMTNCDEHHNIKDEEMDKDIKWWLEFLPQYSGVSTLWLHDMKQYNTTLASDASMIGAGATFNHQYFHHRFSQEILQQTNTIAQLETFAVLIAVKLWCEELSGRVVRFYTDNQNTMYAINNGKSHDKFILKCLRELAYTTCRYEILLRTRYLPTRSNTLPDALSRWYQGSENRRIVRRLTNNSWRRRSIGEHILKFKSCW